MSDLFQSIDAFMEDTFNITFPNVSATDIVEMILLAIFFYELLVWLKNTRAWNLMKGIFVIIAFFILAAFFQMNTILWLGAKFLNVALIALVVVFQPELRTALEKLGRQRFLLSLFKGQFHTASQRFSDHTLNDMVKASFEMGAVRTGALIVIEKDIALSEYERTGIPLDSLLSRQLLINIFEKNTPLHDGAIIVRGDRVVAATCYLPLTDNTELSKDLGTRHRAAIGISEVSDALTIVVSEETGKISVATDGKLLHNVTIEQLTEELRIFQEPENDVESNSHKRRSHHDK